MTAVFGNFAVDFLFAAVLGVIGGVAAELITNKGNIEKPHPTDKSFIFDIGIWSNITLGAVAALGYLFVLETSDPYKFVGAMIGAGVGGSAILTAIKQKLVGSITQEQLETQQNIVENAVNNVEEVNQQLDSLQVNIASIGQGKKVSYESAAVFSNLKKKLAFTEASLKGTLSTKKMSGKPNKT